MIACTQPTVPHRTPWTGLWKPIRSLAIPTRRNCADALVISIARWSDQSTGHGWPERCICNGTRHFFRLRQRRPEFDLREVVTKQRGSDPPSLKGTLRASGGSAV